MEALQQDSLELEFVEIRRLDVSLTVFFSYHLLKAVLL